MILVLFACLFLVGHVNGVCPVLHATACSCSDTIMECDGRGLTTVPAFAADAHISELHLEDNFIENITDNAFKTLTKLSRLFLSNNNISLITRNAFAGLERILLQLDISHNELDHIPEAIADLSEIQILDVSNNYIDEDHFTSHVLYSIGDTLNFFTFGSRHITAWPTTLRHLQDLQDLHVTGGEFYTLPPDAFHGFEGTLIKLTMEYTNLIALPLAVSNLRWLRTLHFDHNHQLGDSGVLIPSFGNRELLSHLTTISLVDDNLTVFPSVLKYLKHVQNLILDSNRLAFVSDASVDVAVGTPIHNLSLSNCSLSRVPGAVSKLVNLTSLNLAGNNIHSFENNDFHGMGKLTNLTIHNNPLEYVANETFKDLKELTYLDLFNTRVSKMPEAIRFLPHLKTLNVPQNSIECTCNIAWLKEFMTHCNDKLRIGGSCETIVSTIADYLEDHIMYCPNYNNQTTTCVKT